MLTVLLIRAEDLGEQRLYAAVVVVFRNILLYVN